MVCGTMAQGLLPTLGEQRAGTAALTFLKIGMGARANGMGGAYVAMSNDASSLYWNPAGVIQTSQNELIVSHLEWLADINYDYLGYLHRLTPSIGLGAFLGYLHLADMPVTTEYHPYGTGEYFSYNDLVAGFTTSIKMTDRFSFGVTIKYVRENLADLIMDGFMMDVGTYYWTGYKSLRFAAAMRNFGSDMRPGGSYMRRTSSGTTESNYEAFSPPTIFTLGVAMDVYQIQSHTFTGSMQMNHPMDDQENFAIGSEYRFHDYFMLRLGWRTNVDENRWSYGAGLKMSLYGTKIKIDYSYADYTHLTTTQQFTFGFEF
jgi:hypothetical protein